MFNSAEKISCGMLGVLATIEMLERKKGWPTFPGLSLISARHHLLRCTNYLRGWESQSIQCEVSHTYTLPPFSLSLSLIHTRTHIQEVTDCSRVALRAHTQPASCLLPTCPLYVTPGDRSDWPSCRRPNPERPLIGYYTALTIYALCITVYRMQSNVVK